MSRKVKANLNDVASDELRKIAKDLQVSESEVLRRALAVMRYYSEALQEDPKASLMLRKGNIVSELIIM